MSARNETYHKLKEAIIYGELSPGEKLSELSLAKSLHTSRTPIREAFQQLQAEGYISLVLNKGAYVSKLPPEEIAEVYDLISLLEGYAAELTALRISPTDLHTMRDLQKQLTAYAGKKSFHRYIEKNAEFHGLISGLSGNRILDKTISELRSRVYRYRLISVTIPGYLERYARDHERILQALSKKDAAQARTRMKKHVLFVKKVLVRFLKENPGF